jgi:NADPH-ferrihemoprotein reductase
MHALCCSCSTAMHAHSAAAAPRALLLLRAGSTIAPCVQEFPSAKPSLGVFFARLAPRMRPRYYSISSSPAVEPRRAAVTVAVIDAVTASGRRHRGVATTHLANSRPCAAVPAALRASSFRLPRATDTPIVMVGPGTGLAPFRGFLQERAAAVARGATLGPALLFFGCRHPDHDYIYSDELEVCGGGAARHRGCISGRLVEIRACAVQAWEAAGVVSLLAVAFSRIAQTKDYVQHHLRTHRAAVVHALESGGYLYVCGDAKHMARDVHAVLETVVQETRSCSADEAKEFISALQSQGRYMQDVW